VPYRVGAGNPHPVPLSNYRKLGFQELPDANLALGSGELAIVPVNPAATRIVDALGGGPFRPFDLVFTGFIPALVAKGFSQDEIDSLFVRNPASAFAIRVRARLTSNVSGFIS
jgi:hypothetical protein